MGIEYFFLSITGLIICGIGIYWFREAVILFRELIKILNELADIGVLMGKPEIIDAFTDMKKSLEITLKKISDDSKTET